MRSPERGRPGKERHASLRNILPIALAIGASVSRAWAPDTDARKDASDATRPANAALLGQLPFDDTSDFDDAKRGLVAPLPSVMIETTDGAPVWDPGKYGFVAEDAAAPDSVSGLFEVTDGIYQVRNQDLSNMTIIEGAEGITIVDPLVSAETAKVALDLYREHRGDKPVKAVIYTHSHVDHYGGVRGVVDEADVESGAVKIYAPDGFMEAAVAENVFAATP